ncbi:hypothetical protein FGO68_gene2449 [Halteria grandinella]|uniref:Uncharacterized protein n=1 Tax=Halteria grandinella TaxID=5974 RepID=A0A8J8NA13_HALGN|nr:hypothetical protein FGO68_gene2449 [Halteria grandinella]
MRELYSIPPCDKENLGYSEMEHGLHLSDSLRDLLLPETPWSEAQICLGHPESLPFDKVAALLRLAREVPHPTNSVLCLLLPLFQTYLSDRPLPRLHLAPRLHAQARCLHTHASEESAD